MSDGPRDRGYLRRGDPGWIASAIERASFVLLREDRLVLGGGERSPILWKNPGVPIDPAEARFLGGTDEEPLFGLRIDEATWKELSATRRAQLAGWRQLVGELHIPDADLAAHALSLERWHERSRFCGRCGSPAIAEEGGNSRRCSREGCEGREFPRTDPVVIAVVVNGERCLLGRHNRARSAAMFTALAGFVEPGESAEQAVVREIREEAGVHVGRLRYFASQPWPFPHSLMLGFHGETSDEQIRIDPVELAEARWFSREEILAGTVPIPPPYAIAHQLIMSWASRASRAS
ncbi:MAG TPA: NAD(+) diphosphatase [Thermoanaerobaculia bacterium]|nr:NAD(+) diphosphatase [Thermoanaerobaculia bacterium]